MWEHREQDIHEAGDITKRKKKAYVEMDMFYPEI